MTGMEGIVHILTVVFFPYEKVYGDYEKNPDKEG